MPTEKETRSLLIDAQLREANWVVDDPTLVVREFRIDPGSFTAEEPREGEAEVGGAKPADLAKLPGGIVKELLELREMIG